MTSSTQSAKGRRGLGDVETGADRKWSAYLPCSESVSRPTLGTYRKGVTSARHVSF